MDYQLYNELKDFKNEKINSNNALESNKIMFELQLKNGLGEEMLNELKNPPRKNKMLALKVKIVRFFEKLFDIL